MKKYFLLFLTLLLCIFVHAQNVGKDYAVFFYVTDFQPGWARLPETALEAAALQTELSTNFNFICEAVSNPSKQSIRNKIREYNQRLTPNDQVFFFFSMHGHYSGDGDRGYLVASDGKANDLYGDSYLSYDDMRTDLAPCRAKHILLALDACHSGSFGIRSRGGPDAPIYEKNIDCKARITRTMQYQGRQYFSSGNKNAKTPAKSLFAMRFLEALRKGGEDGIIQFDDLLYWLGRVDNPRPEGGSFGNHNPGGDFVFVKKSACSVVVVPPAPKPDPAQDKDLVAWQTAKQTDTYESYKGYLQNFPNGKFKEEANQAMQKKAPKTVETPKTIKKDDNSEQKIKEYYKSAIGLRIGYPLSLSFKQRLGKSNFLEVFAGFRGSSFYSWINVGSTFQVYNPVSKSGNLRWYFGGGASAFFYDYTATSSFSFSGYSSFGLGIMGNLGLDYKFPNTPINLSADWMPTIFVGDGYLSGLGGGYGALSVRYAFE